MPAGAYLRVYNELMKVRFVDAAHAAMQEDRLISATKAAAIAAEGVLTEQERKTWVPPSISTVMKWAREQDRPLGDVFKVQQEASARAAYYSRERREEQRAKLLELIDMEIERTRQAIERVTPVTTGRGKTTPAEAADMAAVNLASRIQALANAHGTVASHSRSDQLHGVRMGDIDPDKPADNLEDWNGDPDNLPEDIEERIVDIEASRRRAQTLTGAG